MKTDTYTRIVLTLIVIALWSIVLKPIFVSDTVAASGRVVDTNIKEIGGRHVYQNVLDVNIDRLDDKSFSSSALPVTIKN